MRLVSFKYSVALHKLQNGESLFLDEGIILKVAPALTKGTNLLQLVSAQRQGNTVTVKRNEIDNCKTPGKENRNSQ